MGKGERTGNELRSFSNRFSNYLSNHKPLRSSQPVPAPLMPLITLLTDQSFGPASFEL
ncbi:hypothetical protein LR48_Vigan08g080300 [Vigna angularis]|uniref:Uncharacterized protein n=1 Tax=Phaseolus angularis TaxID=3914 RepID=A0A0L9V4Q7_PHAAN|nr:hypothetical protein LR48_Vigan08g080300 [Vigna angularis]